MDSNLRKYPRAPLTGTVKFYEWNRPLSADVAEISGNGIFVRTDAVLSEGAMVTLRLAIPGAVRGFTVLGKVVRTVRGGLLRPPGLGIEFVDISAADRRSVLEYVARRTLRAA
jgi:Tfp pilus assembly protein PilZ